MTFKHFVLLPILLAAMPKHLAAASLSLAPTADSKAGKQALAFEVTGPSAMKLGQRYTFITKVTNQGARAIIVCKLGFSIFGESKFHNLIQSVFEDNRYKEKLRAPRLNEFKVIEPGTSIKVFVKEMVSKAAMAGPIYFSARYVPYDETELHGMEVIAFRKMKKRLKAEIFKKELDTKVNFRSYLDAPYTLKSAAATKLILVAAGSAIHVSAHLRQSKAVFLPGESQSEAVISVAALGADQFFAVIVTGCPTARGTYGCL